MEQMLRRVLAPLHRRLQVMISRAVGRMVDPTTLLQTVQIELLRGEVLDGIVHCEGYGRTAVPPDGWEGLAVSLGGERGHTVLLSAFHLAFRPRNLAKGEQAIYDDLGNIIHLKRDRVLLSAVELAELISVALHIQATTTHDGDMTINGNLRVNGNITATGNADIGGNVVVDGTIDGGSTATIAGMATVGGVASTGLAGASSMSGNLNVTGGDVVVDGVSSKHHKHADPQGGLVGEPQ